MIRLSVSHAAASIYVLLTLALACQSLPVSARILPKIDARAKRVTYPRPANIPTDAELEAAEARIGEIRVSRGQLFDPGGVDDNSSLFRLANRLHILTREATVKDQLLFRTGERYDGRLLEESARILRDTRYLRDAHLRPIGYHDGVVDIEVITQDVWTFNPGLSFGRKGGKNTSGFELEELNFLGLGTQLGLGFKSEVDRDSTYIFYRDRQLGRSWWDLAVNYSDNSDGRETGFALQRPFYALDTRWAAGVSLSDDLRVDSRYDLGEVIDEYELQRQLASVFWGRSAGLVDGWVTRFKFGVTYDDNTFGAAPGAAAPRLQPADRKLVYPWVGAEWIQDDYQTTRNRDLIERTEDFALGWRARASLGFASNALGSDRDAAIITAGLAKGLELSPRQTMLFEAATSTRVENGALANGLLTTDARYYFKQTPRRLLYLGLAATAGSRLDLDQQVLLGGDTGLRGYPLRYQAGKGRWLFTAEQRIFTNWYPFQLFNVGGAVFYDMGQTWGRDPLGSKSQGLLKDIGFGLRFGNSRSALGNVLHFDVALPLDGDSSINNVQFIVETKRSF
ncbi:MAG TPA: hypothetical protein P5528_14285 [Steroidobacteraceae bacterium]|nr:hypothetical protein [Steroidobacteraceae bacterium]HRX90605.1 hypothetical protein [Steroidobacteraceae bacterium]